MSRPVSPVDSSLSSDGQILYYNMLGVAFSMFAYGVHVALFLTILRHYVWPSPSGRRQWLLFAYICVVSCLATVGITLHLVWETTAFLNTGDGVEFSRVLVEKVDRTQPMILALTVIYMLLNWVSDGMLLYRFCVIFHRRLIVVLLPTAALLALIVFGSYYARHLASLSMNLWASIPTGPELTCLTLSLAFNVVLTALIICKLLLLRYTARQCGVDVSYLSVAGILIESAFPYAMVSTFTLIALGTGSSWQTSLLPFLGQTQAIPSLLIAVRVLENRAISRQEMAQTMSTVSRSIVFNHPRDVASPSPTCPNSRCMSPAIRLPLNLDAPSKDSIADLTSDIWPAIAPREPEKAHWRCISGAV